MGEDKSNVSYECKKCGAKGTLVENVESINLNEIKKLTCGCPAENGIFQMHACIPQLVIPKERTAKIIAVNKPMRLIANSLDVVTSCLAS